MGHERRGALMVMRLDRRPPLLIAPAAIRDQGPIGTSGTSRVTSVALCLLWAAFDVTFSGQALRDVIRHGGPWRSTAQLLYDQRSVVQPRAGGY